MNIEFLILKYSKLIYHICFNILNNSLDAEDMTQEVYLAVHKSLNKYIGLPENEIKNIICKIALNKCRDFLSSKSNKLQMTEVTEDEYYDFTDNTNIEEAIYTKQRSMDIHRMINELKEPYCSILYEYYIKELSLDQISQKRNVTKQTLKVQIHRGKSLLKEKLVEGGVIQYE